MAAQRKQAQKEQKELAKLKADLAKGGAASSTKSGRKQMRERMDEIQAAPLPEKDYKVAFIFPVPSLYLPCTFPVPSLYLSCTFPVPSLCAVVVPPGPTDPCVRSALCL